MTYRDMISSVCISTCRGRTSEVRAQGRSRNRVAVDTQCAGTITGQEHRLSRRTPTRQGRGTFRGRSVGVNRPAKLFGNAAPQVRDMILERTTGFEPATPTLATLRRWSHTSCPVSPVPLSCASSSHQSHPSDQNAGGDAISLEIRWSRISGYSDDHRPSAAVSMESRSGS